MDASLLTIVVSFILGGGMATAYVAFKKAGPEVESISVGTLRGVIEELRVELDRKDAQLKDQNITIGRLINRIEKLEAMVTDPPGHMT